MDSCGDRENTNFIGENSLHNSYIVIIEQISLSGYILISLMDISTSNN
jgi:hypothetical protein